ncbi:MAG: DMT family transporter [Cyanobacteria bacterium P01_F01_bin.86]
MNQALTAKKLHHWGIFLLVLTTVFWATSFPLQKAVVRDLSPSVILSVRFAVAAVALSPWLRQLNLRLLRDGVLLGSLYCVECAAALTALEMIAASRVAFIISLNVILVPVLGTLLGQHLPKRIAIASGLAVLGIGVLSWEGGGLSSGDLLAVGCACGAALYILLLETITPHHPSLPLAATQLLTMALLSGLWSAPQLVEQFGVMMHHFNSLVYLGILVTATPIWTQAQAQRWVASYEAALIYTLEPVFAALLSFWFLGETLGGRGLLGAGIILIATCLSQKTPKDVMRYLPRRNLAEKDSVP